MEMNDDDQVGGKRKVAKKKQFGQSPKVKIKLTKKKGRDNNKNRPPAPVQRRQRNPEIFYVERTIDDDDDSDDDVGIIDYEDEQEEEDDEEEEENEGTINLNAFLREDGDPLHLENSMRIAVAFVFTNRFNNEPNTQLWKGKSGIRVKIRESLGLGINTYIDGILNAVIACEKNSTQYLGKRSTTPGGKKPLLSIDLYEAQIIADCLESGFSIPHSWYVVNRHRKENNLTALTIAPIKNCVKRLKPLIQKVVKRPQGNFDDGSKWCRARYNYNTQILIRFGFLRGEQLDALRGDDGSLPDWFNPDKMTLLHPEQVVWWDETHKKCTIGGQGRSNEFFARFPRDKNGKLDYINGTYDNKPVKVLNCKYDKEVRLLLGCAIVPDSEDVPCGRMAEEFDYSGKCIKSIVDFEKKKKMMIYDIKHSTDKKKWTTCLREKGSIYDGDPVTILDNIADVTQKKLAHYDITTVGHIKNLTDVTMESISRANDKTIRIAKHKLVTFQKQANLALLGSPPAPIDHRKAKNPWLSKFGEEKWKEEERRAGDLSDYVCITEVVEHIVKASAKMYKGTKYEETWMFYHDALKLMTAKATIAWMKKNDYYRRWILPINNLHSDDKELANYVGRPVGNSPENMPLDTSLNNDIHEAVKRHVNATWELHENDPKKFDMSSPKRGSYAYKRVLTLVPCSTRIIQDVRQVFKSMELVRQAKGKLVDGLTRNYGSRWASGGAVKKGGLQERKQGKYDYGDSLMVMHADAQPCLDAMLSNSQGRMEGKTTMKPIADKMVL